MSTKKGDLTSEVISEIDHDDSISEDSEKEGKTLEELKISKEFQENVVKFVKLDDLIRKKQQELSELREKRKPCEQYILKYLDNIKENVIEITDGKLRKNKSETKQALSQDMIKAAILKKVQDPQIVESIMKDMEEGRPLNTHVNIKRTGTRPARRGKKEKDPGKDDNESKKE
ncbi:putative V-type ATP synthase subunit I [Fadolivirus algeromassiliense]|jgi:hypothetical protein|uniref:V-type ATP synthase subunit I n=1 Tax=Fadolivirus FV1/VV64 TaxID=3070911 RepID=A0A7D3QUC4_9VIRU|nr:putative V-type ATP synthase subunit I [Fadolivirus algeromassiliense]QKF94025.1 putative V-type ATP synthase subunit I [Fadolivirus FV1/VV64]